MIGDAKGMDPHGRGSGGTKGTSCVLCPCDALLRERVAWGLAYEARTRAGSDLVRRPLDAVVRAAGGGGGRCH